LVWTTASATCPPATATHHLVHPIATTLLFADSTRFRLPVPSARSHHPATPEHLAWPDSTRQGSRLPSSSSCHRTKALPFLPTWTGLLCLPVHAPPPTLLLLPLTTMVGFIPPTTGFPTTPHTTLLIHRSGSPSKLNHTGSSWVATATCGMGFILPPPPCGTPPPPPALPPLPGFYA